MSNVDILHNDCIRKNDSEQNFGMTIIGSANAARYKSNNKYVIKRDSSSFTLFYK